MSTVPMSAAPVVAPVTSTISYVEQPVVAPVVPSRGYLLLSPADREEMLKEKYTWDEVYRLINRGGVPRGLTYPKDAEKLRKFEEDRNQTRKSGPLNEEVQKRIDRAAQAVAETCLDGAETRRIEAVRMSGGVDRAALERKRILLELVIRCMAEDDSDDPNDPITDPITEQPAEGNVKDAYINISRKTLEEEGKFSEEVYQTLKCWWKLAKASEKTDYMLTEVIEVEPEVPVPIAVPQMTAAPVTTMPYVEQSFSHQAYTSPAFSQTVFHN